MDYAAAIDAELEKQEITRYRLAQLCDRQPGWIYEILNRNSPSLFTMDMMVQQLGGEIILKFDDHEYPIEAVEENRSLL